MAEAVFKKHDVNHDGKMSNTELAEALKELEVTASGGLVQAIIDRYDKPPKNGFLDLAEFTALVTDLEAIKAAKREEVLDTFTHFDKDGNGFIEPDELKAVMHEFGTGGDDATVQAAIDLADINKDGKVSITEFAKFLGHGAE
ncbi:uncharacterized protein LOC144916514 [Branchiostoma floridae x Branchiostoma belcheri]